MKEPTQTSGRPASALVISCVFAAEVTALEVEHWRRLFMVMYLEL